jgi:hypothetical protein
MIRCDVCRREFPYDQKEMLDRKKHGWPVPTGKSDAATGASLWTLRLCADASPQEILAYRKVKADQKSGITCKGFPEKPLTKGRKRI